MAALGYASTRLIRMAFEGTGFASPKTESFLVFR